ncbi:MAG: NAD-dependent epimerase/dehydratase family protein [Chloroflexota bacterium]|jgi:nucleoside-diphosphate-sugar epimerase|nr:NAD-dependent epimerase/dehydratase family protein [Chloroflexota bacterium]MDP6509464.1 NAD-dependent epimerase/dehydratase family protein [Chloroflexota bacterium]MDP6758815.1 NAD-dependent epimerase/dehydratase family protein [Chloroflexota bacterium]
MSQPRSLVTGCAGFVGSHLCRRLLDEGHLVTGIDGLTDSYDPAVKRANLAGFAADPGFTFVAGHLADLDLPPLLEGIDYVFHLAARAGVRGGWGAVFDDYQRDNVTSTQRLLEALRLKPGARQFILASTSSIYGRDPPLPTPETAPANPQSYYAITKLACEKLAAAYLHHFDVPITTLRFYTLYGPRQRPDMAFHIFLRSLLRDEEITVFGDGAQTREVTYIEDAVDAILLSLGADRIGQTFNVGGGTYRELNGYLEELEIVAGRRFRRRTAPVVEGDQLHSRADVTQARDVLGYAPGWSLRDGLQAEFDWLRAVYDDPG